MKTIGIKLADGSFYPVLEDNTPSEKELELTTAHNNQTKVMVDLYRSATGSMDDAEYVDSLQIENLVAHPNGETDIKFTVSLDEDNQLSARIVDSETGNESNTTITLVSRTLEERLITDDYDINDSEEKDGNGAKVAGAVAAGGLLAAAAAAALKNNDETEETVEEVPAEEIVEEEIDTDATVEAEAPVEESDFSLDETAVEKPVIDFNDEITSEEPAEDTVIETEDTTFEAEDTVVEPVETTAEETDSELPDMDFDIPEDNEEDTAFSEVSDTSEEISSDEVSSDETIVEDSGLPDMDFNLPEETENETQASFEGDETITEDSGLPDMDFDMPDQLNEEDSGLPDMDFDLPDDTSEPTETENPELPDDFFNTEDNMNDSTFDTDAPAAGGLNFDGLYDEETERGTPAQNDDDDVKKKTKVPVIICVVCAIICIIATLLILFIIPSKYNLITKKHAKEAGTTVSIEQPAPEPSPAPQTEPEPAPAVPEAKEDEIVIIEKAEEVIPQQPPVAEKPKDITYKIKWGDTLWDIADTYYKNPWRYKYIARYNGIKNPDYIISGTQIVIPAE